MDKKVNDYFNSVFSFFWLSLKQLRGPKDEKGNPRYFMWPGVMQNIQDAILHDFIKNYDHIFNLFRKYKDGDPDINWDQIEAKWQEVVQVRKDLEAALYLYWPEVEPAKREGPGKFFELIFRDLNKIQKFLNATPINYREHKTPNIAYALVLMKANNELPKNLKDLWEESRINMCKAFIKINDLKTKPSTLNSEISRQMDVKTIEYKNRKPLQELLKDCPKSLEYLSKVKTKNS